MRQLYRVREIAKPILAALLFASVSQAAVGGIIFTIDGTAGANALGFTTGQPVQITMQLDNFGSATPTGEANGSRMYWEDEVSADPNMWSNITATGQTGSYQPPTGDNVYNFIEVVPSSLYLWASTTSSNLGFSLGGQAIKEVQAYEIPTGANFPMQQPLPDPNVYFAGLLGTYTSFQSGGQTYVGAVGGVNLPIAVTSLTIAQVPEPSAAMPAGLAGLGGLLMVISRHVRRRRATSREVIRPRCDHASNR